jgi:colicin import membrane protein
MFDIAKVDEIYQDYKVQISEAKKLNEQTVFLYETKQGNKDARSYIYKLRQSKTAIEKARKEAKKESLEYGRKIDSEGKRLIGEIDEMITVHEQPLKLIEQKEADRVLQITQRITRISELENEAGLNSTGLQQNYDTIFALDIDDSYAEFKEKVLIAKDSALKNLAERLKQEKQDEAEQAELERLKQAETERLQKERDERIAREATEKAEREAKNRTEQIEREKLEAEQKAILADQLRIESEKRAKIEREQAVEEARRSEIARQKAEQEKTQAEEAARIANQQHVNTINQQSKESLMTFGLSEEQAKFIVHIISTKQVQNITINY